MVLSEALERKIRKYGPRVAVTVGALSQVAARPESGPDGWLIGTGFLIGATIIGVIAGVRWYNAKPDPRKVDLNLPGRNGGVRGTDRRS